MQNGSKYIPPHLRNSQSGGGPTNKNYSSDNYVDRDRGGSPQRGGRAGYGSRGGSRAGYGSGRGGSYRDPRRSDGFDARPRSDYPPPAGPPPTNSRWSNVDLGGSRRYEDRGGGYSRRDSYARTNERGFHGDMRPDKRV